MVETLATCTTEIGKRNAVRAKSNQVPRSLRASPMTSRDLEVFPSSAGRLKTANVQATMEASFRENQC